MGMFSTRFDSQPPWEEWILLLDVRSFARATEEERLQSDRQKSKLEDNVRRAVSTPEPST